MTTRVLFFFLILYSFKSYPQQVMMGKVDSLYNNGQYAEAIPFLKYLRGKVYRRNSWKINYMQATCFCATGDTDNGKRVFQWMIDNYDLSDQQVIHLSKVGHHCGKKAILKYTDIPSYFNNPRNSGTEVHSKILDIPNTAKKKPIRKRPVVFIDSSFFDIYAGRILPLGYAIKKDSILQANPFVDKIYVSRHFILHADSTKSQKALRDIAKDLEKTLQFYRDTYKFTAPQYYINTFILGSEKSLLAFSRAFHNINGNPETIGYTFGFDNSITAYLPLHYPGTLRHELFHLLIHKNYQLLPPWLEEGLASLYEVSDFLPSGKLYGRDNWRGDVLKQNWTESNSTKFSTGQIFMDYTWEQAPYTSAFDEVIIHARSRYLFLFMQQKGFLHGFILKAMEYHPGHDNDYFIKALQDASGMSIGEFERTFNSWLKDLI